MAIPRHLTADTVSCEQPPTVTTRATRLSKVESSYLRANVSLDLSHTTTGDTQVINNLLALDNLTKLQLDNNNIKKIENIGHLVHLTWLDLSFNQITKVEGLATLTQISDLSLHSNQITVRGKPPCVSSLV